MKAVLMSIKPEWCALISSGKKTIEVRKSRPKIETPFKVYIYCTSSNKHTGLVVSKDEATLFATINYKTAIPIGGYMGNGKVVGEFVCDGIYQISAHKTDEFHGNGFINCSDFGPYFGNGYKVAKAACITGEQALEYLGNNMTGFAWHISDLVIYDEPKELNEFSKECPSDNCWECPHSISSDPRYFYEETKIVGCRNNVKRPPQSWCYVEAYS